MPEREQRLASGAEDLLAIAAALADRFDLSGSAATTASGENCAPRTPDPFDTLAGWRLR